MRLTLALPDLLIQERRALAALPSLATLAHFSDAPALRPGALDDFLLTPCAAATAALAALGAGFDAGTNYVLRADPVSLVAGRNDVALDSRVDDLDDAESRALIATLNAHFGNDGLAFHAPRPDAWFIELARGPDPDLSTTPLAAVRGALYPHLPAGADASTWRRWLSEMQMLLHEHPVNAARAAHGRVPATGVWISGGGRPGTIATLPGTRTFAAAGPAGDVARGLALRRGNAAGPPPLRFSELQVCDDAIVVLERGEPGKQGELDRDWIAPAVAALSRGALEALTLLADGQGVAAAWHARRPAWTRRALAKMATRPFMSPVPAGDDT